MAKTRGERRRKRLSTVRRSKHTRWPFNMQDLVEEGKITNEQRNKFMKMLISDDEEIEQLAVKILRKLKGYDQ